MRSVTATFTSVAQRGVAGTSIREVARDTGLSTGTITCHFENRRTLLLDAIEYGYWRLPPGFYGLTPLDVFRWIIHRYVLTDSARRTW